MRTAVVFFVAVSVLPMRAAIVLGAGYAPPAPINVAPGQILTFYVEGIGKSVTAPVQANSAPLSTSLAGISATFVQGVFTAPLPIFSARPGSPCAYNTGPGCGSSYVAITVQMPFGFDFSDPTVVRGVPVPGGQIRFSENGTVATSVDVTPFSDQIHILQLCDGLKQDPLCTRVVTHADGSLVEFGNPAKGGEEVVIYAVGLGTPQSPITAGQVPSTPMPTSAAVSFNWSVNARGSKSTNLSQAAFAGLGTGYVGLYQINVVVPTPPQGTPQCGGPPGAFISSNLTINVIGHSSFDGAPICVTP